MLSNLFRQPRKNLSRQISGKKAVVANVTSVRVVVFHDLVLIGNDIAKITARRRGYEICSSVAKEDPDTLPSDPINVYWHSCIRAICGRERCRSVRVYSRSPCGCGDKRLDGRPAPRVGIVGLVALTVDPVELCRLTPVAMTAATAKYVAQGLRDAWHTGLRLARQTRFRCLAARPSTSNAVLD